MFSNRINIFCYKCYSLIANIICMTADRKSLVKVETVAQVNSVLACCWFDRVKVEVAVWEWAACIIQTVSQRAKKLNCSWISGPWLGHVCEYEYLIMHTVWKCILLVIQISIQGLARQRVLGWQGWEPLQGWAWQRCYFRILHQKAERQSVCVHVCVSEVF